MTSAPSQSADVVVVGAGAAGLMAALFAQRAGARTLLLERTPDGGRKILISGGGRCNILPEKVQPERFVTDSSPNLLKKMLRIWPLPEQIAFFERELGMPLVLGSETGKYFPESNQARDVRDGLLVRYREAGGAVRFQSTLCGLRPDNPGWVLETSEGVSVPARTVILATGGLSVPKTGSDGMGLALARRLGHPVHEPYPALTPLTGANAAHAALSGVSLDVLLDAPGARPRFQTRGGFLFTHRGYSGPTVLDVSHLAVRSRRDRTTQPITVSWTELPREAWESMLTRGSGKVRSVLNQHLPARLSERLLHECGIEEQTDLSQLKREDRKALLAALTAYPLPWSGDEGYKKAEVTGGGVALEAVDPRTFESKSCPGLFLCGEILDAFGPIGGHNFLWAWATGRAAGTGAAGRAASGYTQPASGLEE